MPPMQGCKRGKEGDIPFDPLALSAAFFAARGLPVLQLKKPPKGTDCGRPSS